MLIFIIKIFQFLYNAYKVIALITIIVEIIRRVENIPLKGLFGSKSEAISSPSFWPSPSVSESLGKELECSNDNAKQLIGHKTNDVNIKSYTKYDFIDLMNLYDKYNPYLNLNI